MRLMETTKNKCAQFLVSSLLLITGLQPYRITNGGWVRLFWSSITATVLTAFCIIVTVINLINRMAVDIYGTELVVTCVASFSIVLASSAAVASATSRASLMAHLESKLKSISIRLGHLSSPPLTQLSFIVIVSSIVLLSLIEFRNSRKRTSILELLESISILYLYLIPFVSCLQLCSIVLQIGSLFRTLNQKVSHALAAPQSQVPLKQDIGLANKCLWSIGDLSNIHWSLCTAVDDMNRAFGINLVTLFLTTFVHIVAMPYFIFVEIRSSKSGIDFIIDLLSTIACAIMGAAQLCLLVWPCSFASNQAESTSYIVIKHLNISLPADTRKKAETFLLQLSHQRAHFSAFGLFTIDLPVITSVVGAVTTYLVILIQFQNSSPPQSIAEASHEH